MGGRWHDWLHCETRRPVSFAAIDVFDWLLARQARPSQSLWQKTVRIESSPVYLDTSALAKLYVQEAGSDELDSALIGRRDLLWSSPTVPPGMARSDADQEGCRLRES